MATNIIVPSLGESIVEATVMQWYKKEGERVSAGEKLVELETDKVNLDVSAEQDGVLSKIERQEGDDVKVGETLATLDENASAQSGNGSKETAQPAEVTSSEVKAAEEPAQPADQSPQREAEKMTPVARRMAEDLGVDLQHLSPNRPGARITKQDVQAFVGARSQSRDAAPTQSPAALPKEEEMITHRDNQQPVPQAQAEDEREERVLLSRRRRTIAQRLVEAQHTAAMLTTFNDVNMDAVMKIRQRRKDEFQKKYGVGLGITSFFVKAVIQALKDHPLVNSELQGDTLIIKHYYDIGVAVGSADGLVVPVIRDADRLSFAEIEKAIRSFAEKTRSGTLSIEDLRGGTFTVTNGGVYGSLMSTPILNVPQVAILGLHRIEDRPVAVNGQVAIQPMMYLALSYDHRVIDGQEAVQFLRQVKEIIESPELMLFG
jgi:2-oxoglutarate dehydrogenase E2 component (dihydrolipoamide succinyltransferase)